MRTVPMSTYCKWDGAIGVDNKQWPGGGFSFPLIACRDRPDEQRVGVRHFFGAALIVNKQIDLPRSGQLLHLRRLQAGWL